MERHENCIQNRSKNNLKEINHMGDLGIDVMIILKGILEKEGVDRIHLALDRIQLRLF
jgi:hypothetical protein